MALLKDNNYFCGANSFTTQVLTHGSLHHMPPQTTADPLPAWTCCRQRSFPTASPDVLSVTHFTSEKEK